MSVSIDITLPSIFSITLNCILHQYISLLSFNYISNRFQGLYSPLNFYLKCLMILSPTSLLYTYIYMDCLLPTFLFNKEYEDHDPITCNIGTLCYHNILYWSSSYTVSFIACTSPLDIFTMSFFNRTCRIHEPWYCRLSQYTEMYLGTYLSTWKCNYIMVIMEAKIQYTLNCQSTIYQFIYSYQILCMTN